MATEHEYKWIVKLTPEDEIHLVREFINSEIFDIAQGYMPEGNRIRRTFAYGKTKWRFTFKKKVNGRQIEIEQEIDERDGLDLWQFCTTRLTKIRQKFKIDELVWELDYLMDNSTPCPTIYFMLLEVEVPEGSPRPEVPHCFKPFVLFEVPWGDDRFSNRQLANVEKSKQLYAEIQSKCSSFV